MTDYPNNVIRDSQVETKIRERIVYLKRKLVEHNGSNTWDTDPKHVVAVRGRLEGSIGALEWVLREAGCKV